ncbi:Hypothetical predicted protein [Prunus dulcis]|uniref:Uncharacterized protein n=1 Tax=Prunus dulcis TaxID=3755 RepID=A0A5E4G6L0_PRUDU|nr:Hypothetical predicted protein [Prunus dulcis]
MEIFLASTLEKFASAGQQEAARLLAKGLDSLVCTASAGRKVGFRVALRQASRAMEVDTW